MTFFSWRVVLFIIALVLAAIFAYRLYITRSNLNVEPHAREEIEKAKRR